MTNNPIASTIQTCVAVDPGNTVDPYEGRLLPYCQIGGPNQYSLDCSALKTPSEIESGSAITPIKRFTLSVAPLQDDTLNYPNDGMEKWLIDLDSEQLYTGPRANKDDAGYKFGKPWVAPTQESSDCKEKYGTGDGAYSIPVPVQGAPVQFRKVYFRGSPVDPQGKLTGCPSSGAPTNSYFAYFACTEPVEQSCHDSDCCTYNPRNDNFGIEEGSVVSWSDFDIGASNEKEGYSQVAVGLCIDGEIISGCILFDSGCVDAYGNIEGCP